MAVPSRETKTATDSVQRLLTELAVGMGRQAPDALSAAWLVGMARNDLPALDDFELVDRRKVISATIHNLADRIDKSEARSGAKAYKLGQILASISQADLDLLARFLLDKNLVHAADEGRAALLLKQNGVSSASA